MNPDALTALLRSNGHLHDAAVVHVEQRPYQTNGIASEFFIAKLRYSAGDHSLPDRMVVKRPLVGDRGQGEVEAYERVLGLASNLPLIRYFGALDEGPDRPLSLLFEDLSVSHRQTAWPIIPPLADCHRAITALSRIHAHWWGATADIDSLTPPVAAHQDPVHLAAFFPGFADRVGEYLSSTRIAHYERVFADLPGLLERRLDSDNATLLHTDPHFWNFLYPIHPEGRCVIFDWPLWRTGLAGCDVAYMIALHLYPEHRRRFEPVLLDTWTRTLQECGVSREAQDVELDYRIGILVGLLMPVMEFSWQIPPLDWMPKLEKAFAAFDDWSCRALLRTI